MSDLFAQLEASLGDEYALERELPSDGIARQFIARERIFNRAVLVKVLQPEHTAGIDFGRFATDVEQAAALDDPHIVPPLMLGVAAGQAYIITPYVPGVTLRERLAEQPPLTLEETVGILRTLADSLRAAHAKQLLHLDVHPGTILLSQRAALLTDIGTVRALRASRPADSSFVGNPSYIAPEQLGSQGTSDERADLYAWGAVAYEMLTGISPAPRSVREGRVVEAPYEEPAPITLVRRDVPATLVRLIMRTLSRDPVDRPASAENVAQVLQTVDVSEKAQAERGLTPAYVPVVEQQPVLTTVKETRVVGAITEKTKLPARTLAMIAGGSLLVVAVVIAIITRTPAPPEEPPLPVVAPAVTAKSTAVLPFAVNSPETADRRFGAGLAAELSQRIAHHGIIAGGTSSAAAFAAQRLDPQAIAARLGLGSILSGTVQQAGDSIHLTVALLSAENGRTLWSGAFDRSLGELYDVEDSIVRAVARVVEGKPEPPPSSSVTAETAMPSAHVLLLQAHGFAAQGTPSSLAEATARYRTALAQDSTYARAHASLAFVTALTSASELSASPARLALIASEASRAIRLDSSIAEAWTALAYTRAIQGANREADRLFRRSIERDSSVATTWGWYGVLAAHVGDYATAHARILRARDLEPASPFARAWDAIVFLGEKKFDRAEQASRVIPRLDSTASSAVLTYVESLIGLDRDSAAVAAIEPRVAALGDGSDTEANGMHAYACARAGRPDRAREILLAIRDATRGPLPPRATLAATLAALGDVDSAIGLLGAAVARRDPVLFFFNRAPRFAQLRKDPRGAALFAEVESW